MMFWPGQTERRRNFELRDRLDEIIELTRRLSRHAAGMPDEDLRREQLRLEWLAEEVCRIAIDGPTTGLRSAGWEPPGSGRIGPPKRG